MSRTIVILNDYCHINGGASRVAIDEATGLAQAGEKVIFLGASGPICKELQDADMDVICMEQPELIEAGKSPSVLLQGLWNREAYREMESLLAKLTPESTVIHLHGYTKALTTSPVRAAVKNGFRVICTLHDFFVACPNGAFFDYVKGEPCPKRGLSSDCIRTNCDKRHYHHKLYRVARSTVQKRAGLLPDGVKDYISLSNRSLELLRPYLPQAAHFYPLENLIDVAQMSPVDVASNTSVVAVGRLDIEKGIELLLKAAQRADVQLTLVGDGPLRKLAETYGNCRVTGWLKPEQVVAELGKARCLAFPSLWYETYGLVVGEAAARGVPAIVSDISAAAERVANNVDGWHVGAGNEHDLTRALELTKNNESLGSMGRAAYENFWKTPPSRERHVQGLLKIYSKMIG